ncbi:hypothetical protein KEM52_001976, partial [Ascosphaera acerosa]
LRARARAGRAGRRGGGRPHRPARGRQLRLRQRGHRRAGPGVRARHGHRGARRPELPRAAAHPAGAGRARRPDRRRRRRRARAHVRHQRRGHRPRICPGRVRAAAVDGPRAGAAAGNWAPPV